MSLQKLANVRHSCGEGIAQRPALEPPVAWTRCVQMSARKSEQVDVLGDRGFGLLPRGATAA